MKKIFWVLGAIIVLNLAGSAQDQKKAADGSHDKKAVAKQSSSISSTTNIKAQLQNSLDVRRAKVGDQVLLKTTKSIKENGETIVPKGSRLVGRVTEVQQTAKGNATSRLGLVFDRIEAQNMTTPITASIISITDIHAATSASDVFGSDVTGSSSSSARTSSGTSSSGSSVGLLGGVTSSVGGSLNTTTQAVGGVAGTTTQALGGATQTVGQTLGGIHISQSLSGSAQGSTTLSSQNKNIHLEKGATFLLQLNAMGGN